MENREVDFSEAWRRIIAVTFPSGTTFGTCDKDKITYGANCTSKPGDTA